MVTRVNKETGVVEESGWGIIWDATRDGNDQMTRINTKTGEIEESGIGLLWDSKKDDQGYIHRVNQETGELEESGVGIFWDTAKNHSNDSSDSSSYSSGGSGYFVPDKKESVSSDIGFVGELGIGIMIVSVIFFLGIILTTILIIVTPFLLALVAPSMWRARSLLFTPSPGKERNNAYLKKYNLRKYKDVFYSCIGLRDVNTFVSTSSSITFKDFMVACVVEGLWLYLANPYLHFFENPFHHFFRH